MTVRAEQTFQRFARVGFEWFIAPTPDNPNGIMRRDKRDHRGNRPGATNNRYEWKVIDSRGMVTSVNNERAARWHRRNFLSLFETGV